MLNFTPEQFIQDIVDRVVRETRKVLLEPKPAQNYKVSKQTLTGPVEIATSIPQAMTDLAQQLVMNNQLLYAQNQLIQAQTVVNQNLLSELNEHRKLVRQSKKNRRKQEEVEEDD